MQTVVKPYCAASVEDAAAILRAGGLVGMPTETVYGLAADALNETAVRAIFAAKGRPADNPLIVHIAERRQLAPLIAGEPSPEAKALMDAYWPGPLTLLFPKSALVPEVVTAGLSTVAVRMPSHEAARALILAAGTPIAAPSGNRSGRPSPTRASHMLEDMDGRIPLILDAGPSAVGVESTVADATGSPVRILRPGGVTPEMIARVTGGVVVDAAVMRPLAEGERPKSPGMKYRHYAPKGLLTLVAGAPEAVAKRVRALYDAQTVTRAILALPGHVPLYGQRRVLPLGESDAPEAVAAALFDVLRQLDEEGVEAIFSEVVEAEGVGLAVMNRLGRAAAFHIVYAEDTP